MFRAQVRLQPTVEEAGGSGAETSGGSGSPPSHHPFPTGLLTDRVSPGSSSGDDRCSDPRTEDTVHHPLTAPSDQDMRHREGMGIQGRLG